MDNFKLDDTVDFSALDVLSSSSTPRLLAQDRQAARQDANQNNDQNNSNTADKAGEQTEEDYSVHLSALGDRSASSTLNLEREVLQIRSDDIGGPSDFTLNMAEWINGDEKNKGEAIARDKGQYQPPSVEDSNTPLPARTVNASRSSPDHDLLKSSQCLTTPPLKPQEDLYAQLAALQSKCSLLQRSNEELTALLQSYRAGADRQAGMEAELRREQDLRYEEKMSFERAQQASDQELQRATERTQAVQDTLNNERAAAARAHGDAESTQQELHSQVALWKQRAQKQERSTAAANESVDSSKKVLELESQLARLKQAHKAELAAAREQYEGVAKDVDDWVVAKMKSKDDHYAKVDAVRKSEIAQLKARNQELERMYSLCGKELMLSWGRQECGPPASGERQRYRYQN